MWRVARVVLVSVVSGPYSGLSDILAGGVCLGAEVSAGGGGESVSTGSEVVGNSAEWDQETLRMLG
jgi:hypothetical protein